MSADKLISILDSVFRSAEKGLEDADHRDPEEVVEEEPTTNSLALSSKADWVPYEGPQGGTGWRNTETDEVVYDDEPPGGIDTSDLSDDDIETLREAMSDEGIDPDEYLPSEGSDDSLSMENVSNVKPISDTDYDAGMNSAAMSVGQLPDGTDVFITDMNESHENDAEAADAEEFLQIFDSFQTAEHETDGDRLLVREVEGEPLNESVNEESLVDAMAASIVSGNGDLVPDNIMVNDEGQAVLFDLGNSGDDIDSMTSTGNLSTVADFVRQSANRAGMESDDLKFKVQKRVRNMSGEVFPEDLLRLDMSTEMQNQINDNLYEAQTFEWPGGTSQKAASESIWVPYEGPQGGTGWKNTTTGEVDYGDEPPGDHVTLSDAGVPDMPATSVADFEPGMSIRLDNPHGTKTGIVTSVDLGADPELEATFDGGTVTLSSDDLGAITDVYRSDPNSGGPVPKPDVIEDLDVETERHPSGYEMVTFETQDEIQRALREVNKEGARDLDNLRRQWKTTSYSDPAQTREKAHMLAADIGGAARNDELDGPEPSDDMVETASAVQDISQWFVEKHYADEDGNFNVHRGLGQETGNELKKKTFAAFAEGQEPDSLEIKTNPMSNYSVQRSVAEGWGQRSAVVTEERDADEVLAATDLVLDTGGGEAEVSMVGNETEVPTERIAIEDDWSIADLFDEDPSPETLSSVAETAENLISDMSRSVDPDYTGTSATEYDQDAVAGMRKALDALESQAGDSDYDGARDAILDAFEGQDGYFAGDVEQAMRVEGPATTDEWLEVRQRVPGGRDAGDWAQFLPQALDEVLDEERANEVMENLTGESGFTFGDQWTQEVADRAKRKLDELEQDAVDQGVAEKAAVGFALDLEHNPDDVDWIARSRPLRDQDETAEKLSSGGPAYRVWLKDPSAAPAGEDPQRIPGGLWFYDLPVDDIRDGSVTPPHRFVYLELVEPDEPLGYHPCADMSPATKMFGPVGHKYWGRYRGPLGGTGWVNHDTGEVLYQDKHPGLDDEGGIDKYTEDAAKDAVENEDPEAVARVVADELDVPQESIDEQIGGLSGVPEDPWYIANLGVEQAMSEDTHSRTGSGVVESMMERLATEFGGDEAEATQKAGNWVPYQGPQGGEGWKNVETDRIVYQDDAPGDAVDPRDISLSDLQSAADSMGKPPSELAAALDYSPGDPEPGDVVSVNDLWRGDRVKVSYELAGSPTTEFFTVDETTDDGFITSRGQEITDDQAYRITMSQPATRPEEGDAQSIENMVSSELSTDVFASSSSLEDLWDSDIAEFLPGESAEDAGIQTSATTVQSFAKELEEAGTKVPSQFQTGNQFENHGGDIPDSMDPANAENVVRLSDALGHGEGGRSERSMHVARNVPDGDGNERDLYVTNTNNDRFDNVSTSTGRNQGGERSKAGAAGFQALGYDAPETVNVPGEFWAVEEADGMPASEAGEDLQQRVDTDDIADFAAGAMLLGAWDVHSDNVFVKDDGDIVPVDLDLAGCHLHSQTSPMDNNPYDVSQKDAWDRLRGLSKDLGVSDRDEWVDLVEATEDRLEEMVDSGEAYEAMSAAQEATDSRKIEDALAENKIQANSGRFFDRQSINDALNGWRKR